jgi:hypothetical protein
VEKTDFPSLDYAWDNVDSKDDTFPVEMAGEHFASVDLTVAKEVDCDTDSGCEEDQGV